MKYLILIYSNPASSAIWEGFSDAEQAEGFGAYAALNENLAASGELIVSEALADASLARRVPSAEGRALTTDGPFAEEDLRRQLPQQPHLHQPELGPCSTWAGWRL